MRPPSSSATSVQIEAFRSQLLASDYLFAGPGSPSYALRNWSGIGIGKILKESISNGATVASVRRKLCQVTSTKL